MVVALDSCPGGLGSSPSRGSHENYQCYPVQSGIEYIYAPLTDNHLSSTGWRQQWHAAVKKQAMKSPSASQMRKTNYKTGYYYYYIYLYVFLQ